MIRTLSLSLTALLLASCAAAPVKTAPKIIDATAATLSMHVLPAVL